MARDDNVDVTVHEVDPEVAIVDHEDANSTSRQVRSGNTTNNPDDQSRCIYIDTPSMNIVDEQNLVRERSGLLSYIRRNWRIVIYLGIGIITIFAIFVFTFVISRAAIWECPAFAKCEIDSLLIWIRDHLGLVQGLVTFFYTTALTLMAFASYRLCEACVWVILTQQSLTITQLESLVATCQGALITVPAVLFAVKSAPAIFLLVLLLTCTLTPLASAPLAGFSYELENVSVTIQSEWLPGGGEGRILAFRNPPVVIQGGAVALYTAYSRGISVEPLPELRDWYVNRKALSTRGNMTVNAVRIQKKVACKGTALEQVNIPDSANGVIEFPSNMKLQNSRGQNKYSSDTVKLRSFAALNVYGESFGFVHENRTVASVVFASLNGTIDGGIISPIKDQYIAHVSAIKCDIDIEFIDDTLVIGNGGLPAPIPTLSWNHGLHVGHCNSSSPNYHCDDPRSGANISTMPDQPNTLNEVILHFAFAPALTGISVDGNIPTWQSQYPNSLLPLPYTSTDAINNTWTIAEIHEFIDVSISAMAISTSTTFQSDHSPVTMTSTIFTRKTLESRAPLLLIPMFIMLSCVSTLAVMNIYYHNKHNLPLMRDASLRQFFRSMHTDYMLQHLRPESRNWNRHGELGDLELMFGVTDTADGGVQVGFGERGIVRGFGRGGVRGRRLSDAARPMMIPAARSSETEQIRYNLVTMNARIRARERWTP